MYSHEGAAFKYGESPVLFMNTLDRTPRLARNEPRAIGMVLLMVLMSMSPILTLHSVSAHAEPSGVTWPLEGSNDTGWVTLTTTGADGSVGTQATADWNLSFAPGAELSNVSLEVRVSGQNDMTIEEPLLAVNGMGTNLFDWRTLGVLGQSDSFTTGSTYNGRLNPNTNSNAGWDLPADAEITEMIIEALAPRDPLVSLTPFTLDIHAAAAHPGSGMLYLAANNDVFLLNAQSSPLAVDVLDMEAYGGIVELVIDETNGLIHMLGEDGTFLAQTLGDGSSAAGLPGTADAMDVFALLSDGSVAAASGSGVMMFDGSQWSSLMTAPASDGPRDALAILELNNQLYVSIDGVGIMRYDLATSAELSTWSTANNLHSDSVTVMKQSGNQLLLGSADNGIGRFDYAQGFWLSTWTSANWLDDNEILGIERVGNQLYILNGDFLQPYNTSNGVFTAAYEIQDFGLSQSGADLMTWPSLGSASPAQDALVVSDASGLLAHLTPGNTPFLEGTLLLASGPGTEEMGAIAELNNILYIASLDGTGINRYDITNTLWLEPLPFSDDALTLVTDGTDLFVGSSASSISQMDASGTTLVEWTSQGCWGTSSAFLSMDVDDDVVVASLENGGVAILDRTTGSCTGYDTSNGIPSSFLGDVALHADKAYVASGDKGVLRYDITNDTWLEPWGSTGVNGVDYAPVAMVGDILHLGLQGYGVVRKDLSTGELLSPLLAGNNGGVLPSNQIYALETDGYNLYIGTQQGARKWDGTQATTFGQGSSWQTRPQQFFDFAIEPGTSGGSLYAGTNIGVCKYSIATMAINDCQNVYDGMPNWATYSVGVDNTYVYGGTTSGVGLITKSNFQHDYNWGEGTQTGNAVVEIMGDIAYIGTDGLGVMRYNITSNQWLVPFTEDNGVLDGGNDDVTGLVADIRSNLLWVGGSDGFQLINVTTGAEAYDIERNSNLYDASGSPYGMMIHNNIMYYHSSTSSDEVSRMDVANLTSVGNLDIGAQVGQNGGDIIGMEMKGDVLMVSVASGQWWQVDGSGGIAMYNTTNNSYATNILPTGSIDRVTSYRSSTGNTWVAWGELRLDLYNSTGVRVNSWDNFEFPIRGIVEYDGEVLFASEDGILRYDEATNQWLSTWEAGNGLPNNAGSQFYELWTDGNDLVVGGASFQGWGGFREGIISHLDATGSWTAYPADSYTNIADGYPISMEMCGGALNVAMYNNNGGIARIDLVNGTVLSGFDRSQLDGTAPASVACDSSDTLYIGYYADEQPISKYSFQSNAFLGSLTTASHNLPSDRIWYDSLAHENGQLIVGHGLGLQGNNLIGGGFSIMSSNGATTTQASVQGSGSSVTSFQWLGSGSGWMMGQAGGSSGYSHVSTLNALGTQKIVDLPGLVSGQVPVMVSNATHIWAAVGGQPGQGQFSGTGSGLLQGAFLPNGEVEWQYGWTLAGNSEVNDLYLSGTDLFIATNPNGMIKLDTTTRTTTPLNGALHGKFDTMHLYNNELIIGLAGDGGSPPGVQVFDLNTQQFGNGRLIAGLPSSIVNGFTGTSNIMYIATNGGIGRFNYTLSDWMDPITNGLPSNVVEDVVAVGTDIYIATPAGLYVWDETTNTGSTFTTANGLMGNSVWGLATSTGANGAVTLIMSHDGRGSERPGVTTMDTNTQLVTATHRFDQLPSNGVISLASDWWGLHVGTDTGPLTHWNASSADFEDGLNYGSMYGLPTSLVSDGTTLMAFDTTMFNVIEATSPSHGWTYGAVLNQGFNSDAVITSNHIWMTTTTGLWGFEKGGLYAPLEGEYMRSASPLTVRALTNGGGVNITDMTHPGMAIELVDPSAPYALDSDQGETGVHGLLFQNVPLIFTSPVEGAAIWTKSVSLNYDATLDLSQDPNLELNLQSAVDNGLLYDNTRHVSLRLYSPSNGTMEVRMTYDYVRNDTPVTMEGLVDRPDDGGGVLTATWSLVHDEDFARYLIFVNEGPWSVVPSELNLMGQTPDKTISMHSRLGSDIDTANGLPLVDGREYYAVVVVEYNDGRWGEVSAPFGPSSPSDEIPGAPLWATASPMGSNGDDGDLELEWARCTALDLARTNIYVSRSVMTDALGMVPEAAVQPNEGNQSILSLTPGVPVWIGFTCVDEANQENLSNVTVVGPVVPTGELNDNDAPEPIEGTQAYDVPEDEGGRIMVTWNQSTAEDCAFYTIFMKQGDSTLDGTESGVDGFSQATVINSCETTDSIISSLDGVPLIDGQIYSVGVVAYDLWLNGNTEDVMIVTATPFQNILGQGSTPERITSLLAFDHANDDGTAIDVVWEPSTVDDFASYTLWVADQPVNDLSIAYATFGTNEAVCGCFTLNKQWIDERTNPIELTLSTALYGGSGDMMDLTQATPQLIKPDIELFVAVTVHDLKGNVHLTNLTQATVTPINNIDDTTAPDRLAALSLTDRPNDDGSALLLDFDLSASDDVASYKVYAATYDFDDVTMQGDGPQMPIATMDRNPNLPLTIDIVAGDTPVIPGQSIWVAVVVEDTSGNAYMTNLLSVQASSVDDGVTDLGGYLPDIEDVAASWFEEQSIFVEWSHSTDASVRGYLVYIADDAFTSTDDATMVGEVRASNSLLITSNDFADLTNDSAWYVAVVPFDESVSKSTVESVEVLPFGDEDSSGTPVDENGQLSLESLLTGPNLIAAGMLLVVVILLVIIVRSRGNASQRNKSWELQEATWGIQENDGWGASTPPAAPPQTTPAPPPGITTQQASEIYAAPDRIQGDQYGRPAYESTQPVLQPQVNTALLDGLLDDQPPAPPSPQIDTSFLDDLL